MSLHPVSKHTLAIIGGGPAGLIAAESCAAEGCAVTLYDRMAQAGRKFMMAGRGGLNLTHSETLDTFIPRYGAAAEKLAPHIRAFSPDMLRDWCKGLSEETFIGSSGRVFPKSFKASPLLRAWLQRLNALGVRFAMRHVWQGWDEEGRLVFQHPDKKILAKPDATILALGGASWPHLGADGGWVDILRAHGIATAPLQPSNCGFIVNWSPHFIARFAGQPLKTICLHFGPHEVQGEAMISQNGIEGSAVYALSSILRDTIAQQGKATITLDLRRDVPLENLTARLGAGRGSASLSTFLKKAAGLSPLAIALLQEARLTHPIAIDDAAALARLIKALPLTLTAPFSIHRAISSAGGIIWNDVDETLMLKKMPGVFIAGEMLDWEAPTGGYLLQGCFSTGLAAAKGAVHWLEKRK